MFVAFWLWTAVLCPSVHAEEDPVSRGQATRELALAEKAVAESARLGALWTTAQEALMRARKAHAEGDLASVIRHARTAVEQARLGIAQQGYPPLRY